MTKLTDEMLMAYADGQLGPADAKEVEIMVLADSEAARKVEALRRSLDLARTVMERPLREPVPQKLIDTVLGTAEAQTNVVPFVKRWRPASRAAWALPLAAALMLTVGLATYLGRDRPEPSGFELAVGPLGGASPLTAILENTGSGQGTTLPGGRKTALILATFRDSGLRPCREFEILGEESEPVEIGVACREGDERWHIVGAAEVPAALTSNGTFLPSSNPPNDPLRAVLESIGAGTALSPEEEAELVKNRWASPAK